MDDAEMQFVRIQDDCTPYGPELSKPWGEKPAKGRESVKTPKWQLARGYPVVIIPTGGETVTYGAGKRGLPCERFVTETE